MWMLTPALAPSANEGMIELKQCTGYTMWIGAHDRWHRRLPRQLNLNPPALRGGGAGRGVDNSTQGTMCCAPPKLVPWVKRTRGSSDGDTLIRDSQVFYHSVRLELDSFDSMWNEVCSRVDVLYSWAVGHKCIHPLGFYVRVARGMFLLICKGEVHIST